MLLLILRALRLQEIAYPSPVRASVYTEERRDRSDSSWHASFEKLKEYSSLFGVDLAV